MPKVGAYSKRSITMTYIYIDVFFVKKKKKGKKRRE